MTVALNAADIKRYRKNPDSFVDECLINPETGKPFDLYEAERVFLRCAFQLNKNGRLMFPLLMFCAIKKSGKTVFGAIFVLVLGPVRREIAKLAGEQAEHVPVRKVTAK